MRNGKGDEVPFSWRDLRRFVGSYARPELPRRDADQALEVMGELALVREAGSAGRWVESSVLLGRKFSVTNGAVSTTIPKELAS